MLIKSVATNGPALTARSHVQTVVWRDKLYLIGGTSNATRSDLGYHLFDHRKTYRIISAAFNDVYVYDPVRSRLSYVKTTGTPMPPNWAHRAALVNDRIYVFGTKLNFDRSTD